MSSARTAILGRIRSSLKVKAGDAERLAVAGRRIDAHAAVLVPARATGPVQDRIALFRSYLEGQQATVIEVGAAADVPQTVARYLGERGLPAAIRMGSDARLASMPWASNIGLTVSQGAAEPDDATGLHHALAGIAETGTLVIAAGRDNPVTLAFLPATHIIVVAREAIVGSYEEANALVRHQFGAGGMPRTLNYVSGPSRTADIGGKIVIGAHGPRSLCVVIVG